MFESVPNPSLVAGREEVVDGERAHSTVDAHAHILTRGTRAFDRVYPLLLRLTSSLYLRKVISLRA